MKRIKNVGAFALCSLTLASSLACLPVTVVVGEEAVEITDATLDTAENADEQVVADEQPQADEQAAEASEPQQDEQVTDDQATDDQAVAAQDQSDLAAQSEEGLTEQAQAKNTWVYENGSYYFYNDRGEKHTGWLVWGTTPLNRGTGLQRYWLDPATGALASDRLISPDECGWWAYARPEGYVVRGKYKASDGKVYLANNDGKLQSPGWLVTNAYDGLQRYWIDAATHACVPGYSADGWDHYTRPEGYVARGKYKASDGKVYLANNDGKLERPGWLVTNAYDAGHQRYWIDAATHACVPGYSADGWKHYNTKEGYVLRGFTTEGGVFRYANNDGLITDGWVVTDKFGQGFQRYWQQDGKVATDTLVNAGNSWFAYARPEGYVVRGKWISPTTGFMYYADNDGRLERTGWRVSDKFGDGLQRYYFNANSHAAEPGFFQAPLPYNQSKTGWFFNVPGKCYVVRGKYATSNGLLLANNDGVLAENSHSRGFMTTKDYDGSSQKYYLADVDGHLYAKTGFFDADGKKYYADPERGCVQTSKIVMPHGIMLAASDGVLAESTHGEGWLITRDYDGSAQRYYLVKSDGHLYCRTGFFTVDGTTYYGMSPQGYVVRGRYTTDNGVLLANNDGVLAENTHAAGMLVTNEYDGALQRYYLEKTGGHIYAKTGLFTYQGKLYYGLTDRGYVSRNDTVTVNGKTYQSNNDGVLTEVSSSYSKTRDPYLARVTWSGDQGYLASMAQRIASSESVYAGKGAAATNYAITVDIDLCRVVVLQKSGSGWKAVKTLNGNLGRNSFKGQWKIEHKQICNWDDSYFGKGYNDWSCCYIESYASYNVGGHARYVPGKGYEDCQSFHATGYTTTGYDNTGCVGLVWDEAKWIYDNCPVGTWVVVF